MKSCEGIVDNKLLVDVPGHRRLRNEVTGTHARHEDRVHGGCAADATRQAKAAAELLYEIFCCEIRPVTTHPVQQAGQGRRQDAGAR